MAARIPIIRPGQTIKATYLNQIGGAINEQLLSSPRDLEKIQDPVPEDEQDTERGSVDPNLLAEVRRTSTSVRVYQDGDEESENYVDIERATVSLMFNPRNGDAWVMYWLNE